MPSLYRCEDEVGGMRRKKGVFFPPPPKKNQRGMNAGGPLGSLGGGRNMVEVG